MAPPNDGTIALIVGEDVQHAVAVTVQAKSRERLVGEDAWCGVARDPTDRVARGAHASFRETHGQTDESAGATSLDDVTVSPRCDFRTQRLADPNELQALAKLRESNVV